MRRVTATFPTIKVFGMALKGGLVQRVCTSPLAGHLPHQLFRRRDRLRGRDYADKLFLPR